MTEQPKQLPEKFHLNVHLANYPKFKEALQWMMDAHGTDSPTKLVEWLGHDFLFLQKQNQKDAGLTPQPSSKQSIAHSVPRPRQSVDTSGKVALEEAKQRTQEATQETIAMEIELKKEEQKLIFLKKRPFPRSEGEKPQPPLKQQILSRIPILRESDLVWDVGRGMYKYYDSSVPLPDKWVFLTPSTIERLSRLLPEGRP